jgi:NAD(P)-dependent dehydrogenase (short-subunit alcohol dehydrogenase family)
MAEQVHQQDIETGQELTGTVCLVTGSSRGIGRCIAEELAGDGADVIVNYRSSDARAHDVVDRIEDGGGSAMACRADVRNYGSFVFDLVLSGVLYAVVDAGALGLNPDRESVPGSWAMPTGTWPARNRQGPSSVG